jgi:PAS domain S-box-containing protein
MVREPQGEAGVELHDLRSKRLAASIRVAAVITIICLCALTALALSNQYRANLETARVRLQAATNAFSQNIRADLKKLDNALFSVGEHVVKNGIKSKGLPTYLQDMAATLPLVRNIMVLSAQGKSMGDSTQDNLSAGINFRWFPIFQDHLGRRDKGLILGSPYKPKFNNKWTLPFSRAVRAPDGSLLVVVVAGVDPFYFSRRFVAKNGYNSDRCALIKKDGTLVSRYPQGEKYIGNNFRGSKIFSKIVSKISQGTLEQNCAGDGARMLISFQSLEPLPLVLTMGREWKNVLASFYQYALIVSLMLAGLLVAILLVVRYQVKNTIRLSRATLALQKSEDLFRSVVGVLREGVVLQDASEKVLSWNQSAERILGNNTGQDWERFFSFETKDSIREDGSPFPRGELPNLVTLKTGRPCHDVVMGLKRNNGKYRWISVNTQPLKSDGTNTPYAVAISFSDITERKQDDQRIKTALVEKEALLKEIHHRVKNNMQVVSSLLSLQKGKVSGGPARRAFEESQERLIAMSLIHEKLYQSENLAEISLQDYLQGLIANLGRLYEAEQRGILFQVESGETYLGINNAVPCGLVLNELVSNALKHAFPRGKKGLIKIKAATLADKEVLIEVSDNGVGIAPELNFERLDSLGLGLVKGLVENQLKGSLKMVSGSGTAFIIRFPQEPLFNGQKPKSRSNRPRDEISHKQSPNAEAIF